MSTARRLMSRINPRLALLLGALALVLGGLFLFFGSALRPEAVRDALLRLGPLGPIAQIAVLAGILTVPIVPATIFQIAGGWAFGKWLGFVFTMIGDALGAALGFWVARRWGDRALGRWLGPESLATTHRLAGRMSWRAVMVLRLLPGPAYTAVSMAAGLSPLRFGPYITASVIGVAPWIALLVLAGDVARDNPLYGVAIVVGIVLLALGLGRIARRMGAAADS
jgi:uncharacterized membrane protein YdjX (TVP38/TMEM64 family)